jgi:SH3-like domain-containing protein
MRLLVVALALLLATSPLYGGIAIAQSAAQAAQPRQPQIGTNSGLPIPRFVSLKYSEVRARRGPSEAHRIDWLYQRRGLPMRVTAEFEHWRRVEDAQGEGGWIHYSQLSGTRTVQVMQDMLPLLSRPAAGSTEIAVLEANVIAHIMECGHDWCRLSIDGIRGWAPREALWGLLPDEVLD